MARRNKKYGWAKTNVDELKGHPASYQRFNKSDNSDIYFITYTHQANDVELFGKKYKPQKLLHNIDSTDSRDSHYLPILFKGKRSHLDAEETKYKLHEADKEVIRNSYLSFDFKDLNSSDIPFSSLKRKKRRQKRYIGKFGKNKLNK